MKGLPRYLKGVAFFCVIGLHVTILNVISIEAQGLTAEELLVQKEQELIKFVGVVEANARNCDALKLCSGVNCSRLNCYAYGTSGDSNYQCLGVFKNSGCGSQCKERNFDYSRGFLRRVDTVNAHIAQTVCTHRNLDDSFKSSSINDRSHFFRAFFGAVDGTTRVYPGADEDCNDVYDPRLRPWYLESTDVRKVVILLVDSGHDMTNDQPAQGETYITTAKKTALKVLETLTEEKDYVNIMSFDGDGTKPFMNAPTTYKTGLYNQSFIDDSLTSMVKNRSKTDNPSAAGTGNAINFAISQLNSFPETYLKVVLVLTGGQQFQTLTQLNITANTGVNVFVYNFHTKNRSAECSANSNIRAYLEEIPDERFDNPLYALHSYYSFLAKIHRSFKENKTDYGKKYPNYSGVDNSTLALSKAAFGPTGELLGVLGIDFFEKKVEEQYAPMQFQAIVDAARNHASKKSFNATDYLTISVCFNHPDACPDTIGADFLCKTSSGDKAIGCCGKCKPEKTEWGKILGGVAAGIVGLLAIAVIVYCKRSHIVRRLEDLKSSVGTPHFTYPGGPENGTVLQGDTTGNFGPRDPDK